MKMTKREIVLLTLLIIIAIVFVEFRFVVRPSIDQYWDLTEKKQMLDDEVNMIKLDLALAKNSKEKRDGFIEQIGEVHDRFLGPLQESILFYYSYDLMNRNGFTPDSYTISPVSAATPNPDSVAIQEISYQLSTMVEEYRSIRDTENQDSESADEDGTNQTVTDLELLEMMITGSGTYDQLKDLLNDVYDKRKSFLITYLNMNPLTSDSLSFELRLQFYGLEKFESDSSEYNTWGRPSFDGGTDNPFFQDFPDETDVDETDETTPDQESNTEDGDA